MKTKYLAVVIVVFLLCGVAVAQEDYYIRTDSRINLRATYSLEGEKVETVPEGTILHVVGRFNRWLKIDEMGKCYGWQIGCITPAWTMAAKHLRPRYNSIWNRFRSWIIVVKWIGNATPNRNGQLGIWRFRRDIAGFHLPKPLSVDC